MDTLVLQDALGNMPLERWCGDGSVGVLAMHCQGVDFKPKINEFKIVNDLYSRLFGPWHTSRVL